MAFERKIAKLCKSLFREATVYYDHWLEYEAIDVSGSKIHGWAQPDVWLVVEDMVLVVEAKLSQNNSAIPQLQKLYRPLLSRIYAPDSLVLVHAFRNSRGATEADTLDALPDALRLPRWKRKEVQLYQHIH